MFFKSLSVLALAGQAFAQNTPTLAQALNSSSDLSTLAGVLNLNPQLVQALSGAQNITILAPSNKAFSSVPNATLQGLLGNAGLITAVLQYHVLNGTVRSDQITNSSTFVPTLLTDRQFTNVTGGQRVEAVKRNNTVYFFSGLLDNSTVSTADVNFTGGVIHVIDRILTLPDTAANTLSAAGLTSLRGAVVAQNLTSTVNTTPDVTIFAPNNAAFQAIGSGLGNLTSQQVTDILSYHVIAGTVGYSSSLRNGTTLRAANGGNLTVTINDGRVFVNNARVVIPNVLIANGVVHVIDQVLNPTNATIANPNAQSGSPAYSGASSVSNAPFTSGQPTPSRSISGGATSAANPSGSASRPASTGAAAPMQTGAIGLSALLGVAAVYFL